MTGHVRRIGALLALAVAGYLLGGCAGGGSGLPTLTGVTLPTGSLALPTLTGATETSPGTTSTATTTVTEPTTITQPETTTVIETLTTDTAPTTDTATTEATTTAIETETTDTAPTDTSDEPVEDEGFWRRLALVIAAIGETGTEPETPVTTIEAPASTTTQDTSPVETVAAEAPPSDSDTPWGWIALGFGLVLAAAIAGFVIWRRKRQGTPPS